MHPQMGQLVIFSSFISEHITIQVLFEVKVKEIHHALYDPTKEVIKRFRK